MQNKKGFTLIELLVVIAIIIIIAAISIPNFLRSRMSANEVSALASSRQIATAQIAFKASTLFDSDADGEGDYGTLGQLADPDGAGVTNPYIDEVLGAGTKGGYLFTMNITLGDLLNSPSFSCVATPVNPGQTGLRQYFVDDTGVLRTTLDGTPVGPGSPVI